MIDPMIQKTDQFDILIVDDSPESLELLARILVEHGYQVRPAPNGHIALKSVAAELPDLILLDVKMPEMDGLEVCRRLKSKAYSRNIPIIFISSYDEIAKKVEGFQAGGVDYIAKPFEREEVLARVEIHLRLHELTERLEQKVDQRTRQLRQEIAERKQAEEELRESKKISESLIQSLQDGFTELDVNGVHLNINPAFLNMTGFSEDDIIGTGSPHPYWPPEEIQTIEKAFQKTLQKEHSEFELVFMKKNGERFPVIVSPSSLEDTNGNILRYFATVKDITERKAAEQALIDSEKKWKNILVNIPQIGIGLDTQARIIFANDYFLSLTGWKRHEIINQNWFDMFIPENIREQIRAVFSAVMGQRDTLGYSTHVNSILTKSGEILEIAWSNILTKDADGYATDVTCLGVDLTERHRSEQALKKSEKKYRTMVEAIKDPVYICSQEYRIKYMNQAMIDRIGYNAVGELCHKVLHDLDERCPWCDQEQIFDIGHSEKNIVSPIDNRTFHVSSSTFTDIDGSILTISVLRDITEYITMQERLQQIQKMESIGNLAGGIAHDFNNILTSIIGFTELALDEVEKDTTLEDSLQEVYKAGNRAKALVKQILAFARQSEETLKPVQPSLIAKEVLKFIRSTIPVTIKIKQSLHSDSLIKGNATQLHQVLMNLCTNAAHSMQAEGGILEVSLKDVTADKITGINKRILKHDDYIKLKVSDTGEGIAPDIMDSIFEPYFTTKDPGEGTGMGLAMVQGIVDTYGGHISVDSKMGKGSLFTLYFPITRKRKGQRTYIQKNLPTGTERVLFVDDEASIARIGGQILERLGYTVTTRTSSIEALELLKSKPNAFDLIITDMTMPNMTGDQLAIESMYIRPDIPIILCTGYSNKISEETAFEIGIKAFAYKPIVKSELAKTVRKVLDEAKGTNSMALT